MGSGIERMLYLLILATYSSILLPIFSHVVLDEEDRGLVKIKPKEIGEKCWKDGICITNNCKPIKGTQFNY